MDTEVAQAFHVAGRALAAVLRGWTAGQVSVAGYEGSAQAPESAGPFIAYAGLWAAARRGGDLVGDAIVSDTLFAQAMSDHPGDASTVGQAQFEVATLLARAGACDEWGWLPGVSAAWQAELEQMWPVVQHVAVLLLAGRVVPASRIRRLSDDRLSGGLAV
ncbi:MAG: hypothetical protein Q4P32_05160 [Micrococcales bacterium]|nr:hypothetical protein [Micrococcales bacterium]